MVGGVQKVLLAGERKQRKGAPPLNVLSGCAVTENDVGTRFSSEHSPGINSHQGVREHPEKGDDVIHSLS